MQPGILNAAGYAGCRVLPRLKPVRKNTLSARAVTAAFCLFFMYAAVAGPTVLRVGVLSFGTVNWELEALRAGGPDREDGLDLRVVGFAGKRATSVALQGGAVDAIVTDWLWVSRQRAAGRNFTFIPYSVALGALLVPPGSTIRTLADLPGRKLAIAGGPLDKNWVLLRAGAKKRHGVELDESVAKVFGAPPLLSEQLRTGAVDAVLTFWHFAARLEAAGMRRVLDVEDLTAELGITAKVPQIGYVFRGQWLTEHPQGLRKFARAVQETKKKLLESDADWQRIRPLMKAKNDAEFAALVRGFRAGVPMRWGAAEREAAARLYALLASSGGEKLVGPGSSIAPGTFADEIRY